MDSEERNRKLELLSTLKQTRHNLELQIAKMKSHTPAYVRTDLKETEEQIAQLEKELGLNEEPPAPNSIRNARDPFEDLLDRTPSRSARRRPTFEVREDPFPPTRDTDISQRYVEDLLKNPRSSFGQREEPAPQSTTFRKILLGIALILLSYLIISIPPNGALVARWAGAARVQATPTSQPPPLVVGNTWKGENVSLTLADVSYAEDTFTLTWELVNSSQNDSIIARADYIRVDSSKIDGVETEQDISCPDFVCGINILLKKGWFVRYAHTVRYPGIQIDQITTPVFVTTGLSGDTRWRMTCDPKTVKSECEDPAVLPGLRTKPF